MGPTRARAHDREDGATLTDLARGIRERAGAVYAVAGTLYLLLVLWGPTPAFRQPLWILIFAGLIAVGLEAFRRLTVREFPAARV